MKIKKFIITDSIFVAILPVLGYLAAYFYQLGFYAYYDVPSYFMKVDLETIITSIVTTCLFAITAAMIYPFFNLYVGENKNKVSRSWIGIIGVILVSEIIITIAFLIFIETFAGLPMILRVFIFLIPCIYFNQLLFLKSKSVYPRLSYLKGLKQYYIKGTQTENNKTTEFNYQGLNSTTISLGIVLLFCLIIFPNLLGKAIASSSKDYLVFNQENHKYIIVGKIDDKLISVKLKDNFKETDKQIRLLLPENLDLKYESLGEINFERNKTRQY
ncbi:MAG: hypothetical protein WC657_05025 [Candidatus Paceibacterota bacterium]|jgi:hypothetical protein